MDTDANRDIIEVKNSEIAQLQKELEESRESVRASDLKAHQAKRFSDLARNKISTATECLNMYLADSVKKEYFDEFNHSFKFLVSQYSSLLNHSECYSIDSETKEVKLSDTLFKDIIDAADPLTVERISDFKKHFLQKISLDLSVRNERRLSSSLPRTRTLSNSTKRIADEKNCSKSKIARPSLSS